MIEKIQEKCGLDVKEQEKTLEKVADYIKDFFKRLPENLTNENASKIAEEWKEKGIQARIDFRTQLCGSKVIQDIITLTEEDLKFLKISSNKLDPYHFEKMDCITYALIKTREVNVIERIQSMLMTMPEDFYQPDPMKYFQKWGYGTAKAENAKLGDLVVYLIKKPNKTFKISHIGVMTDQGLIESKMGNTDPG